MNIYVGNLNFRTTDAELREAFEAYGEVSSVNIITDKFSGKSRGFAFVEMPSDEEGQTAIEALNGADLGGRALKVNVARPKEDRRGGRRQDRRDRGNRNY
jgi:RNA recognition motif-containing protein